MLSNFRELDELMEKRVAEYEECVARESLQIENASEEVEIPVSTCDTIKLRKFGFKESRCSGISAATSVSTDRGCWRAVARVKQKCQRLHACCPPAKTFVPLAASNGIRSLTLILRCLKQVENTRATLDLRAKHVEINRRTLDCRNEMRQMLASSRDNASESGCLHLSNVSM